MSNVTVLRRFIMESSKCGRLTLPDSFLFNSLLEKFLSIRVYIRFKRK